MSDAVVWGLGELGSVFARGLLRAGRSVHPIVRGTDVAALAARVPEPDVVLIAVGEAELDAVLGEVPAAWRDRSALLQNELRPRYLARHGLDAATLAIVWFEKKRGTDVRVLLPTIVSGAAAAPLVEALDALGIPAARVERDAALAALAAKNLYILVTNVAGLVTGGDVGALLSTHRALALEVARDVLALESALFSPYVVDGARALEVLERAGAADPRHLCTGRSAPARLARSLAQADALGLQVPALRKVAASVTRG
jgi:ketopantoate reductase